jgi:uncharacterized Zn-finger protein
MAVAKKCDVCKETFCNKSNLNRHMKQIHSMHHKKKKNIERYTNSVHKKTLMKMFQMENKKKNTRPTDSIDVKVLNKVLWKLLLQLIDHKCITVE